MSCRAIRICLGLLWLASLVAHPAVCEAQQGSSIEPLLPRFGFNEPLTNEPGLANALTDAGLSGADLSVFVRLEFDLATTAPFDDANLRALDGRMGTYAALDVPVLLAVRAAPIDATAAVPWQESIRALAERYEGVLGWQIGAGAGATAGVGLRTYAYFLKLASVQIRSVRPAALILPAPAAAPDDLATWLPELYAEDVGGYVDAVAVDVTGVAAPVEIRTHFDEAHRAARNEDSDALVLLTGLSLGGSGSRHWLAPVATLGFEGPVSLVFTGTTPQIARAVAEAGRARDLLAPGVVVLNGASAGLRLSLGGQDVTASLPHRLLYDLSTLSMYLVHWDAPAGSRVTFEITDRLGQVPMVVDVRSGAIGNPDGFVRDDDSGHSRGTIDGSRDGTIVAFRPNEDPLVQRVAVSESTALGVNEIVVRHQQAQATQDALYHTYVARASMAQHFRPSPTDTVDVVSNTRYYVDREGVEWEELSFSVNGATWGADRPAFPLLQPEKVLSLPLDLRLGQDYRYVLHGVDTVAGRRAYVVSFDPLDDEASLYRGRVWIDAETFVRLKVRAVQTRLTPPTVSNEETQYFEPVSTVAGAPLYLFARLVSRQIFLIAGRNLLVEKEVRFSDFQVDSPDFVELRETARRSDRVMYRDTDQGLRYFVRRGDTRVISDEGTKSATAMAMGVTIDPSFDYPLPIVGINHLDFEFLGGDTQLAMLFGGVLVLGNVQKPRLGSTPFDASIDLFAIAVPGNDQVFGAEAERRGERVRSIPFSTGVNLGYQATDFQRVMLGYEFRYDAYLRDEETAVDFVTPSSTVTNGATLAYEYSRGGYTVGASAGVYRRGSWAPWGPPSEPYDPDEATYRRYQVTASKDFHLDAFQRVHVDGAWFGGEDLDRFSSYQFGLFDKTRMHGVPSAGIRFPELAMVRASYSFNLFDQYRFDAFVDQAFGKDPRDRSHWLPVTGTGVAVHMRAPHHTILRLDVGKSFLPRAYTGAGSVVVQVQLLKPL